MTIGFLPVFLVGSQSVLMRDDIALSDFRLGIVVSLFFGSAASVSAPGGRLAERIGADRSMDLAMAASAVSLGGIAVLARSWVHLALLLVIGGVGNGLSAPSTNLSLARAIPPSRQGLAFGLKGAAIALATMLAGAAVPLLGTRFGWRWAFAASLSVACGYAALRTRDGALPRAHGRRGDVSSSSRRSLLLLAAAGMFGTAAANALGGFYVPSAVALGHSEAAAGLWLAIGGLCGITGRIAWGWFGDRRPDADLALVAVLLAVGAAGFALLSLSAQPGVLATATLLAYGAGWAWSGLLIFSVVRHNDHAPAAASGLVATGGFVGGIIGPFAFGLVAHRFGFAVAWPVAGSSLFIAAALSAAARRHADAALLSRPE